MAESQASGVAAPGGEAAGQFQPTSLYVGDLDLNVTDPQLWDHFIQVGSLVSVRVCRDHSTDRSLGYGYVNYLNHEDAARAMEQLNLTQLNNKSIRVMYPRDRRTTIFVWNLDREIDDKALQNTFSSFGNILSCEIKIYPNGQSKGNGFVQFATEEAAKNAINELNGKLINDRQIYVAPFLNQKEREAKEREAASYHVFLEKQDPNSPFIAYGDMLCDTEEAAQKVIDNVNSMSDKLFCVAVLRKPERETALNGKMTSKPLDVALAQHEEESGERLQAQFSQINPVATPPSIAPCMPMYPPGAPGIGQQLSFGQAPTIIPQAQFSQINPVAMPPSIAPRMPMYPPGAAGIGQQLSFGQAPTIIPQAGFGYQQQLVPGMRPGGAPMPSFYVPLVQPGQQGQRPGPVHQTLQPVPMMQQQMLPRGWMYGYPPGGNVPDVPMPGVAGGMLSVPYYMGGMLPRHAAIPQRMPNTAMASAFANATPEQQWTAMQHSCT